MGPIQATFYDLGKFSFQSSYQSGTLIQFPKHFYDIKSELKKLLGVDFLQANDPYCRDSKFVGTLDLSKCTSFHTKSKLSLPLVMSKVGFQIGAH